MTITYCFFLVNRANQSALFLLFVLYYQPLTSSLRREICNSLYRCLLVQSTYLLFQKVHPISGGNRIHDKKQR